MQPIWVHRCRQRLLQRSNERFRTPGVEDVLDLTAPNGDVSVPVLEQPFQRLDLAPDRLSSELGLCHSPLDRQTLFVNRLALFFALRLDLPSLFFPQLCGSLPLTFLLLLYCRALGLGGLLLLRSLSLLLMLQPGQLGSLVGTTLLFRLLLHLSLELAHLGGMLLTRPFLGPPLLQLSPLAGGIQLCQQRLALGHRRPPQWCTRPASRNACRARQTVMDRSPPSNSLCCHVAAPASEAHVMSPVEPRQGERLR